MDQYIVNRDQTKNPGLHHEVHTLSHAQQLGISNYIYLGFHTGCSTAVTEAQQRYEDADGCAICCAFCHQG